MPLGKLVLYLLAREGKVTDAHAQVVGVPKPKDPGFDSPDRHGQCFGEGFSPGPFVSVSFFAVPAVVWSFWLPHCRCHC